MMKVLFLTFVATLPVLCWSQQSVKKTLMDANSHQPIQGAKLEIEALHKNAISDSNGLVILKDLPRGNYILNIESYGYKKKSCRISIPNDSNKSIDTISLDTNPEVMEEVQVSSTRSSRNIKDIPTRVETISAGELDEKAIMQPANVKMALTESTGIQTQQTSSTSANSSIRIQGLDGKYTLLLKDGFPLFGGYSGGLSLLQVPPLDLKRIEVIKGASSTLYGGGAIAGLVNFVTKQPTEKKELSTFVNLNQTGAVDANVYSAHRSGKMGYTVFASRNSQKAYDVNQDGLSDIPQTMLYNFNPRFFYYPTASSTFSLGINSSFEKRLGGDMLYIDGLRDSSHPFFERNTSSRVSSQMQYEQRFSNKGVLTIKNSVSHFNRDIAQPTYFFGGEQWASFTEANYLFHQKEMEWVVGGNVWTDKFVETNPSANPLGYSQTIGGVFAQNNYKVSPRVIVESGVRADATDGKDLFFLPRASLLYKLTNEVSTRLGGGMGYKLPTIFSEESEERGYQHIRPIDALSERPEKSTGLNMDINYRKRFSNGMSLSFNQMFFFTQLNSPIILKDNVFSNGDAAFMNADGHLISQGFETNLKLTMEDISLYGGYTYTEVNTHYSNGGYAHYPLTAKNRILFNLSYDLEDRLQVSYELFYTGPQYLRDGEWKKGYWVMGCSAMYTLGHFLFFINTENFTDSRVSRFGPSFTGSIKTPRFPDLWAPTDGFILNGGVRVQIN